MWMWAPVAISRRMRISISPFNSSADRKSTRLNSSHSQISYAVFCLKKKNRNVLVALGPVALGGSFIPFFGQALDRSTITVKAYTRRSDLLAYGPFARSCLSFQLALA